jgi:hypothetical protein
MSTCYISLCHGLPADNPCESRGNPDGANEPVEKVTFLKTGLFAGSKIGNYFLSSKVFGLVIGPGLNFLKSLGDCRDLAP